MSLCKKAKKKEVATETTKGFQYALDDKRLPVKTPKDIVDDKGQFIFGTFDAEFPKMSFTKANKPYGLPNFTNKTKLTTWEAAEVVFDDIAILTAVSPMFGGIAGPNLTILYDKKEKKRYTWMSVSVGKGLKFADNLLDENVTEGKNPLTKVTFVNDLGKGKAYLKGKCKGIPGKLKYDLELTRFSKPSVVSIPFAKNMSLYSQKDVFTVQGSLTWNGKTYTANERTAATIDDHRGYYPYNAHYDWVATMGALEYDGKLRPFGFNLTRNQSIDQDKYNENLLFLDGKTQRLTPVTFDHVEYNKWHVTDEYGMVDLTFDIGDRNITKFNLGVIAMNYHITFGELSGYICDEDGNKYCLDGMTGIGEDKSTRM